MECYQEEKDLIPTSPAWAVLLKVVLRSVRLAPKVDGFDDDVSGHKNDNEEIEENFVACLFGEWANILKVMYYLHLLIFFCVIWIQMDILITSKALFRPSQDDPLYRLVVKSLEKWLAISNMKVCDPKWKVKVWVWHLRRRKAWGCCRSLCTCDTFDQTLLWIKFMFIVHFVVSDGNDILLKMLHFLDCLFPHVEADPSMVGLPP